MNVTYKEFGRRCTYIPCNEPASMWILTSLVEELYVGQWKKGSSTTVSSARMKYVFRCNWLD